MAFAAFADIGFPAAPFKALRLFGYGLAIHSGMAPLRLPVLMVRRPQAARKIGRLFIEKTQKPAMSFPQPRLSLVFAIGCAARAIASILVTNDARAIAAGYPNFWPKVFAYAFR